MIQEDPESPASAHERPGTPQLAPAPPKPKHQPPSRGGQRRRGKGARATRAAPAAPPAHHRDGQARLPHASWALMCAVMWALRSI